MDFRFEAIEYDKSLPSLPKHSGVYKIFDIRGKLIVLDKTSNLFDRFERYYGERSERVRDLDLREITGRIEYIRTDSTFETQYVLYKERKRHFPRTYRKMRTFRLFTLMKTQSQATFSANLCEPPDQSRRGLFRAIRYTRTIHQAEDDA